MFREKEICNAIRTAYLYLFPDKKERKRALSRLNMELVAQSVRYRGESVLAYQTAGNHECSLNYYGPELFPQRGFCIYQKLSRVILRRWMLLASGNYGSWRTGGLWMSPA